ncbi:DUF6174 domain-containing protein [Thalassotalea sp. Y01]|uniref:DUF6174 domain-containing protein n=1 Tax=Thalassotalea sp. Y01 TaxID=2729613 RepID=UPI00145F3225|nr:DUF6174 domain-containing protein [Thalassotalea sp. Y01]NMP16398.1 hypothetical protein [Thalassotalea sp. Y01]
MTLVKWMLPILATTLMACGGDDQSQDLSKLKNNRQKWESQQIDQYAFDIDLSCFCFGNTSFSVEQRGSEVIRYNNESLQFVDADQQRAWLASINQLFDFLEQEIGSVDAIDIEYDETYGYPTYVYVDRYEDAVDDEYSLSITNMTMPDNGMYVCNPVISPVYRLRVIDLHSGKVLSCETEVSLRNKDYGTFIETFVSPQLNDGSCAYNASIQSSENAPLTGEISIGAPGYVTKVLDIEAKSMACGLRDAIGTFYLESATL